MTVVLDSSEYQAIHTWLRDNYGRAHHCESSICLGYSNTFHWALKRECEYEKNRDNFMMLCAPCHRLYDYRPEWSLRGAGTREKDGNLLDRSAPWTIQDVSAEAKKLARDYALSEKMPLGEALEKLIKKALE